MNFKAAVAFEFGPFRLEPSQFRLLRDGRPVLLTPKAFETLLVLTENAGHVVEKNDLLAAVWPNTAVEESTIAQNIFTLRKVLGTTASGGPYIETVPKRGYRLAVRVEAIDDSIDPPVETSRNAGSAEPTNVLSPLAPPMEKRRRGLLMGAAGLAAVAVSMGVYWLGGPSTVGRRDGQMTITRLTNTGNSLGAAISPDGKFVAYVLNSVGQESLWLRLVDTRRDLELVPLAASRFQGITFSHDGNWIYYISDSKLYEVSVLGGRSRKLLNGVGGAITLSPDGQQFAFVRDDLQAGESAVVVASMNGGASTTLASRTLPDYFRSAAWAPRGDVIVASVGTRAGDRYMTLTEIAVRTGSEQPITSHRWFAARQLAWLSDETGLILSASAHQSEPFQLWHVSYPAGRVTKITNDLDDYFTPALTAASDSLVSSKRSNASSIWVAPRASDDARRITGEAGRAERPSWTSDGRIIYESTTTGNRDLWIMDSDGSNKKQLTFDSAADYSPSAALQGDHVYFVSDRTGIPHIWRMDIDGANPKQLTEGEGEMTPDCSPDGKWLVYEAVGSGRPLLWRVPTSGGAAVQLTTTLSRAPAISPDGTLIALYYWDERRESPIRLAVIPSTGGPPVKSFDFPDTLPSRFLRWSTDGRAVTYVATHNGISNIWSQSLEGGPPRPVTQFGADVMTFFDWSPVGEQLAFSRHTRTEDVVLMRGFK